MSRRLVFLLALLIGCAALTAMVIVTYRAPFDPQVERNYAEWVAHWKRSVAAMVRERHYPEAERTIRNYLRYAPDDGEMRRILGKVLCENGNYAEALDVYYVALLKDPEDFVARNNYGVALTRRHQLVDAERELQEAFEASGGECYIGFNLSRVYARRGKVEESRRILRRVITDLRRDGGPNIPDDAVVLEGFVDIADNMRSERAGDRPAGASGTPGQAELKP